MGVVQERVILVVDPLVVLAVEELEIQETLEVLPFMGGVEKKGSRFLCSMPGGVSVRFRKDR